MGSRASPTTCTEARKLTGSEGGLALAEQSTVYRSGGTRPAPQRAEAGLTTTRATARLRANPDHFTISINGSSMLYMLDSPSQRNSMSTLSPSATLAA